MEGILKKLVIDKSFDNKQSTPQNENIHKTYYEERNNNDAVLFELKKLFVFFHKTGYDGLRVALKKYDNDMEYKI